MNHQRCICPRCGTTLRVKDRTYLNRPVPCPSCRIPLILQLTEADQLEAVQAEDQEPGPRTKKPPDQLAIKAPPTFARRLRGWFTNVTVASWIATLSVAGMMGTVAFWPKRHPQRRPAATSETVASEVRGASALDTSPDRDDPEVSAAQVDMVDNAIEPEIETRPEPVADAEPEWPPADAALAAAVTDNVRPIPVAIAPEPLPPVDFEAALSQPLSAFRQIQAIPRQELLDLLEELLGAPIRYDPLDLGDAAKQLEQKISFELQDITVGDVLDKVLDKTEISYDRERDGLRLRKVLAEPPVPGEQSP